MKNLKFLQTLLLCTVLSLCFTACSSEDEEESVIAGGNDIRTELKSKKWYYTYYDVDNLSEEKITIYFINDTCGVTYAWWRFLDISGSDSSKSTTFEYEVIDNRVILYSSGITIEYYYVDGYLIKEDECYESLSYNSSDYAYIKEFDPAEKERKKKILETIKENLKVTESFDGVEYTYTFDNTLDKIYPSSKIEYYIEFDGVCNNYKYCKKKYCDDHKWYIKAEKNGNKYVVNLFPVHPEYWAPYSEYLQTKDALEDKINSGLTLSNSEKDLYNSVKEYIEKQTNNNYDSYPCVKIDGEDYELEYYNYK